MTFKTYAQSLSPRALWLPGDGMTDESGNGFTATNNGGTTSGSGGPGSGLASYMSFNGSTSYLDLTTVGTFGQSLATATVVLWVRTSATGGGSFLGTLNDGSTTAFLVQANYTSGEAVSQGRVRYGQVDEGGHGVTLATPTTASINNGEWHMVVARCNTNIATPVVDIRVDDVEQTESYTARVQQNSGFASFQYVLTAGVRNVRGTLGQWLACDIAGIALFDSNLTTAQVRTLYAASLGEAPSAWTWLTKPSAVEWDGTLYLSGASMSGETVIDEYTATNGFVDSHILRDSTPDDHDNASILIKASNPPIVFYAEHNDTALRYRVGTQNIESGFALGSEQTIAGTDVTYSQIHESGGDIWVIYRDAADIGTWRFVKSTNWGTSWSSPQDLFDHTDALYLMTTQRSGVVRCAMSRHPTNSSGTQTVYYAEINLSTGAITQADGTSLGNLDGTSLPISITSCGTVGTATNVQWVLDVSDGPDPEVLWADFSATVPATTGAYKYSVWNGSSWTTNDIVDTGDFFGTSPEEYLGNGWFPIGSSGGKVLVAREDTGTWYLEEHTTTDSGSNWAADEVYSGATAYVRPAYTSGDGSVSGVNIIAMRVYDYSDYVDYTTALALFELVTAPIVELQAATALYDED